MKTQNNWIGTVITAGLALALFGPAAAQTREQTADPTHHTEIQSKFERGDREKPVVPTYNNVPPSQSNVKSPRANDVSSVRDLEIGDDQKPVVTTYDKRPDPEGDEQDLDSVRYQESNEANDGLTPQQRKDRQD